MSKLSVERTGIGNVADKKTKNYRKTMGLLRDLKGAKTVGVINEYPELGIPEIARPVGVVGALLPSTNPVATPLNKTLNALKCRNAIILSPSSNRGPLDLVQKLPSPVSKTQTKMLMQNVDLVVVTGSQNNVRTAYSSGTPAIGVDVGNVPVIIDESADIEDAISKIVRSKIFDNATSCSSENSLIILDKVYDSSIRNLTANGGLLLSSSEEALLLSRMWVKGVLSKL